MEEDDYLVVVFKDAKSESTIEFQYGEPDEQDIALGLTGVCVVVNGGAATAYQAVAEWSIEGDDLTVALTKEAAVTLGMDRVVQIELGPLLNRIEVETALRRVLAS